jgi:hypothetical protein
MSYCRFQNTLKDLTDCRDALDNKNYEGCSNHEQLAIYDLIALCQEISIMYENFRFKLEKEYND